MQGQGGQDSFAGYIVLFIGMAFALMWFSPKLLAYSRQIDLWALDYLSVLPWRGDYYAWVAREYRSIPVKELTFGHQAFAGRAAWQLFLLPVAIYLFFAGIRIRKVRVQQQFRKIDKRLIDNLYKEREINPLEREPWSAKRWFQFYKLDTMVWGSDTWVKRVKRALAVQLGPSAPSLTDIYNDLSQKFQQGGVDAVVTTCSQSVSIKKNPVTGVASKDKHGHVLLERTNWTKDQLSALAHEFTLDDDDMETPRPVLTRMVASVALQEVPITILDALNVVLEKNLKEGKGPKGEKVMKTVIDLESQLLTAFERHAYLSTAVVRLIALIREKEGFILVNSAKGVLFNDRQFIPVWWAINALQRQTVHIESLGVLAHFYIEGAHGCRKDEPEFKWALGGLEKYRDYREKNSYETLSPTVNEDA